MERIAPEAMALLTAHPPPGNVREIAHTIERAVMLRNGIREDSLGLTYLPLA